MSRIKYLIITGVIIAVGMGIGLRHIFTRKFADTANMQSAYRVNALELIKEFIKNDTIANIKYAEKIITVTGIVTEIETADTTVNLKLGDTVGGSYIIFAFQSDNLNKIKNIKEGDKVAIKGSCSGGAYSKILTAEFITFKRCVLDK